MNDTAKTLIINTVAEEKYLQLSAAGKIRNDQLFVVDNDDAGRTVIASYDIVNQKLQDGRLSLSYDEIDSIKYIRLIDKNGNEQSKIDATEFIKDGVLNNIEYISSETGGGLQFTIKKDDTETVKSVVFVDSELLSTSTNAIQNKVVYDEIGKISSAASSYTDSEIEKLSVDTLYQRKTDSETSAAALDSRICSIEQDYLKASDRTELQGEIDKKVSLTALTEVAGALSTYADFMAASALTSANDYTDDLSDEIKTDLNELSETVSTIYSDYALSSEVSSKDALAEEFKKYQLSGNYLSVKTFEDTIKLSVETLSGEIISKTISITETTPEDYFKSYTITQGETQIGAINIPKDFLVKSGSVQTCDEDDKPVPGYIEGDKYLDFVVNVVSGEANDQHIYINVKDLTDIYKGADGEEISVGVDSGNNIGAIIKAGAVNREKIADSVYGDISSIASSYVENRVCGLDTETVNGDASKTISKITETDGIISAEFTDISVTQDQVSGLAECLNAIDEKFNSYYPSSQTSSSQELFDEFAKYALSSDVSGKTELNTAFETLNARISNFYACMWSAISAHTVSNGQLKSTDQLLIDDIIYSFHDMAMNLSSMRAQLNA